jgi:tetratricopeptide (TPR) repeat protein
MRIRLLVICAGLCLIILVSNAGAQPPAKALPAAPRCPTVELDPGHSGGELRQAHALASHGCYLAALQLYENLLRHNPADYDALQGKAFALIWTHRDAEARPIFRRLCTINPHDKANNNGLAVIARNADAQYWAAVRPPAGAPPEALLAYSISFLSDHPGNPAALRELVAAAGRLKDYPAAIRLGWRALQNNPNNHDIQAELARILSWDHQYNAAITLYQKLLRESPDDREMLEALARVYAWSGRLSDSLQVEKKLVADKPSNPQYRLELARLELRLHRNGSARKCLSTLLRMHPLNRDARLELARLDMKEAKLQEASTEFRTLLGHNFQDPDALYGAARIDYYKGDLRRALPLATNLVSERPKDSDALLLLARIERALHQRKAALALLDRASQLNPRNQELESLRKTIHEESSVSVHTSASYAREVAIAGPLPTSYGSSLPSRTVEDLNMYGASTRVNFAFLPESSSYFLTAFTPSNSPLGGIQGAVAPAEFLYGQSTQVLSNLTVRGGFGVVRMGPGEFFATSGPVTSLAISPVGYMGATLLLNPKLSFDFTASQTPITYTPTSTRFGARQKRIDAALNYKLDPRTRLRIKFFRDRDLSSLYDQTRGRAVLLERNGYDRGTGGQWMLTRNLIRSQWFSCDAGYAGMAFSYAGQNQGVFMGFFNPAFYQQHLITSRFYGQFWGPVQYTLTADAGIQQTDAGGPLALAQEVGPGVTVHMSRPLSVTVGYLHYNFAQSLGSLRGNVVQFSTDYHF